MDKEFKKVLLAGVGLIVKAKEKGEEIIDELIEKGEKTFEQRKLDKEELKRELIHKIQEKEKDLNSEIIKQVSEMQNLSEEDIKILKEKIAAAEKELKAEKESKESKDKKDEK